MRFAGLLGLGFRDVAFRASGYWLGGLVCFQRESWAGGGGKPSIPAREPKSLHAQWTHGLISVYRASAFEAYGFKR